MTLGFELKHQVSLAGRGESFKVLLPTGSGFTLPVPDFYRLSVEVKEQRNTHIVGIREFLSLSGLEPAPISEVADIHAWFCLNFPKSYKGMVFPEPNPRKVLTYHNLENFRLYNLVQVYIASYPAMSDNYIAVYATRLPQYHIEVPAMLVATTGSDIFNCCSRGGWAYAPFVFPLYEDRLERIASSWQEFTARAYEEETQVLTA